MDKIIPGNSARTNPLMSSTKNIMDKVSNKMSSANKVANVLNNVRSFGQQDTMGKIGTIAQIVKLLYSA